MRGRGRMGCEDYRERHPEYGMRPYSREEEDSPEFEDWLLHGEVCSDCRDWELEERLVEDGVDVEDWPCVHMADVATFECEEHEDPLECPAVQIHYEPAWDEFRLAPREPDADPVPICNCPWCGVELPESRYPEWLEELRAIGYDEPTLESVPEPYQTDEWWADRTEH